MPRSLAELLQDDRVHLIDGAMGTMLYAQGVFVNVSYDELNITEPDLVKSVHEAYVRAGAELIETNTFGANPVKLTSHSLETKTEEINARAGALARQAAGDHAVVLGAMGPLGIRIEPWGPTARGDAEAYFGRQVAGLMEGGVDGFILETFSDIDEIQAAIRAVRAVSDLPVFAQMTVNLDGNTSYGTPAETIASVLQGAGADVIGINCSVGPAAMLDTIERLAECTSLPVSAQPNAGLPREVGDRTMYMASPEYMAQYARRIIDAGAKFIGGCCGTTPDHIRQMAGYVRSVQPRASSAFSIVSEDQVPDNAQDPKPLRARSRLGDKLATGSFTWTVEVMPPRGWDATPLTDTCRTLADAGVDAAHIVDGSRSHGHMGALPAAMIAQRDTPLETIVHYTCRDRNMMGMVHDLLGAAAAGVRNIQITTGGPPVTGQYPDSTAVYDIDSIGLTNVVYRLNRGLDPGGNAVGSPTEYVIGVSVNHAADDAAHEAERFAWKREAGADYALTHPVFDADLLKDFLTRHNPDGLPIMARIWPLTSLRSAEYLANEVPDAHVPDHIIDRMRSAGEKGTDAARAEGVAIAREIIDAVADAVQGVQVVAPFGKTPAALSLLQAMEITAPR